MELNENQVWNNGEDWLLCMTQLQPGGVWTTAGKYCLRRSYRRTGDQLPQDMGLAILLSMCPTDLEKELTAQQHLFPNYAQMKAHIVTVIKSRTRGLAPMMMGILSDEDSNHHSSIDESLEREDGELFRLETQKRQESLH